jgi:hypothetical protein
MGVTAWGTFRTRVVGADAESILGTDDEGSAVGGGYVASFGCLAEAAVSKRKRLATCVSGVVDIVCILTLRDLYRSTRRLLYTRYIPSPPPPSTPFPLDSLRTQFLKLECRL